MSHEREAFEAWQRFGSKAEAARQLCIPVTTLKARIDRHQQDPAITDAQNAVGTTMRPQLIWAKTKGEDGTSYSVLLKPDYDEDFLGRVRDAFEDLKPATPVIPPEKVAADLCNVFPLFDVHWGMHAWGKETRNQDYDLKEATADMKSAFEAVLQLSPKAQEAILIVGGDFFHADDNTAETPKSRHKLDVDGRFYKVVEEAIDVLSYVVERLLCHHQNLTICTLRGNHDEHSHLLLHVGLGQRYRDEPRVTVEPSRDGLFMRQWGRSAIFAHHGDKAPPERQALYLSDVCSFWSATRHRHYYTGHVHKDQARDIGPLRWESLRAFCPPDAYAAGMGYAGRRALRADTFHNVNGRVLTAMDPIERLQE